MVEPISEISVPGVQPVARGKVREIFEVGEDLLLVATDRISAFDVILPRPIPGKGIILTQLTRFWLENLAGGPEQLLSTDADQLPEPFRTAASAWGPRFMLVKRLAMFPVECVVRGYLVGSGWLDYQRTGRVCGIALPPGLEQASALPEPIFTPAAKASEGHDENITAAEAARRVGRERLEELRARSLELYERGRAWAADRGIILADTKFEFGCEGQGGPAILADEVLTPDSSRYWPESDYRVGISPPSFDKQYVRDYLKSQGWQGEGAPPDLPGEVVEKTAEKYAEIYARLTGASAPI